MTLSIIGLPRRSRLLLLLVGALLVAGLTGTPRPAAALDDGLARTPPLGWNTWNTFGCNINEALIRQMADVMVSNGMRAAGYQYVVVDDCWFNPNRDANGNLQGDPQRFPSGMKALGDYLHARGLKFGLYQVPTEQTCAQRGGAYPGATGSQGHETQDANQFAAWGVDYLKYDWCSPAGTVDEQVTAFARMRDALHASGRPIVFSINPNSYHPAKTGPVRNWGDVAHLWRTTEDITTAWDTGQVNGFPMGIKNIVDVNAALAGYAAPGRFNDPDMLEVGNGGLTDTEMRSHFALWAVMAAPLIAGNDLRTATTATTDLLKNRTLLSIDQDPLGLQAWPVSNDGSRRVLAKRLSGGDVAVALFNQGSSTTTISTTAAAIGLTGSSFTLLDAWTGATTTSTGTISASVPAHDTIVYRVSGGTAGGAKAVVSAASARCLDVPMSNTTNGTQPVVWDCSGAPNQRWAGSNGTLQSLGVCLDAPLDAVPGTKAEVWTCNGGTNQQWTPGSDGSLRNGHSGLCLDVEMNRTTNGSAVILWTCHSQLNQYWTTRP